MDNALASVFHERQPQNLFSFWYPRVKDCGIPCPRSCVIKTPTMDGPDALFAKQLFAAWFMENPEKDSAVIRSWVKREVLPVLETEKLTGHIFVKNGTFSKKFSARGACNIYGAEKLPDAIAEINYAALCLGAGGAGEIVVREFIEHNAHTTPTIYEGLPLRPEFRVFYDFDNRKPVFTWNYWDPDYVLKSLHDITDRIIFEHERDNLENFFHLNRSVVQDLVASAMQNVQGMSGSWSIDIMWDELSKQFWLIDMARAENSTYWENKSEGV